MLYFLIIQKKNLKVIEAKSIENHILFQCAFSPTKKKIVAKGDRIAQLILEKIATPEVQEVTEIEDTVRGAGGFGSTGKTV